jgi:two-component system, OmpR family, sensor histidine kinase KdpD
VLHGGKGTVTLRVRLRDGAMEFLVLDEGPGLPANGEAKLFEKFWRGENAAAGGTGLGLPIVKGFAGLMGASVTARNRTGGKGAVFVLTLPKTAVLS